ncbi:hypothetical protein [Bacillus sp. JCM 19041]
MAAFLLKSWLPILFGIPGIFTAGYTGLVISLLELKKEKKKKEQVKTM